MFRKFFTTNQLAKVGSILAALGFWIFATSTGGVTQSGFFPGTIPIHIDNVPVNLIATMSVDTVRVRISAEDTVWKQLKNDSFVASVDLSDQKAGVLNVPVQLQVLASNVQLLEVSPKTVAVQLEEKVTKQLPVQVTAQGTAASGFFATTATSDPSDITVSGPTSQMDRLDHVTAVIDVSGANSDREGTVEVQAIDASGHELSGVTLSPEKVKVTQHLTRQASTKSVGIQVVTTGTPQTGKLISPTSTNPLTVLIAGSEQQLANISSIPTNAIDISKMTARNTVRTTLNIPSGITTSDSQDVQVTFDVTDQKASQTVSAAVSFANLAVDRHVVSVDPATPQVIVQGSADKLKTLSPGDVTLLVDLSGLGAGSHQIALTQSQLKLPDGVTFQQFVTDSITVVLN